MLKQTKHTLGFEDLSLTVIKFMHFSFASKLKTNFTISIYWHCKKLHNKLMVKNKVKRSKAIS